MKGWALQDAKARFSELVESTVKDGPQVVTKHGVPTVIVVSVEQWRRLQDLRKPTLKALLLADEPRAEIAIPPRGTRRRRSRQALA